MTQLPKTTLIRLGKPGVQRVKIHVTVWFVANSCCLYYRAKGLQMGLNLVPNQFYKSSLSNCVVNFVLRIDFWRKEASKRG